MYCRRLKDSFLLMIREYNIDSFGCERRMNQTSDITSPGRRQKCAISGGFIKIEDGRRLIAAPRAFAAADGHGNCDMIISLVFGAMNGN